MNRIFISNLQIKCLTFNTYIVKFMEFCCFFDVFGVRFMSILSIPIISLSALMKCNTKCEGDKKTQNK